MNRENGSSRARAAAVARAAVWALAAAGVLAPALFAAEASAGPAARAAAAVESARFIIRGPGETIGREAYEVHDGPGAGDQTVVARAAARFRQGGTYRMRQTLVADSLGRCLSYDVVVDSPSRMTLASLSASNGGWEMSIREEGADSIRSARVEAPSGAAVLDPFFATHYQRLLDRLFARGVSAALPESVFVVTPQSLLARWVPLEEIQGEVGFLGERSITARRIELRIPDQTTHVWFDGADGRVLRVLLGTQRLEILREGFRVGFADSTLPRGEPTPLAPVTLTEDTPCARARIAWPESGALAVALLLPDDGPPGAPADTVAPLAARLAPELLARGIAVATIDPAGGCGEGAAVMRGFVRPAREAIEALQRSGVPVQRIVLVGHGLGAVAACRVAADDTAGLGGVVLLAPPARSARAWLAERVRCGGSGPRDRNLGWSAGDWAEMEAFEAAEAAAGLRAPVFVLSGSNDCETEGRRSLNEYARALRRANRAVDAWHLLDGADHEFRSASGSPGTSPGALALEISLWMRASLRTDR